MIKTTEKTMTKEIDIFLTAENFEDTMNGLKGVYYRLYSKESDKPNEVRDQEKIDFFYKNYKGIVEIKNQIKALDWVAMDEAIKKYNPELKKMVELELSEYVTVR